MNRMFLFIQLFFCLHLFAAHPSGCGKFTLSGKMNGKAPRYILFAYIDASGKRLADSARVDHGRFEFSGLISGPTVCNLTGKVTSRSMDDPNRTMIFLEPGPMEIELSVDSFSSVKVKGSVAEDENQKLNITEHALLAQRYLILKAMDTVKKRIGLQGNSKDLEDQMNVLNSKWSAYANSVTESRCRFIRENSNSAISAYLLPDFIYDNTISLDSATIIYGKFPETVKNSALGKEVARTISGKRTVVVGKQAPVLKGLNIKGNIEGAEDYIGKKFVLLDFWASWCVPCHDEFPYINDIYDKYEKNGLQIIGVSADVERSVWKKDIIRSKIGRWKHLLSVDDQTKIPGKQLIERFAIGGYPTVILIDRSGKIIYRSEGVSSDEMTKLDEIIRSSMGL